MLDIRATNYVSPLSEVPFTDIVLTVHLANVADETGFVTGTFRVYNTNTGTLLHISEIAPVTMSAGQVIDVDALTDFDPPAPLDDTYFVIFDGNASNNLVPHGIGIHLGSFHFDVKVGPLGPAPAAHGVTHEDLGSDPLDHGTLPGLSDDDHPQYQEEDEKGAPGGYCGLPAPLDTALPLRADGTPGHPSGLLIFSDLLGLDNSIPPFKGMSIPSGQMAARPGELNHPGIQRITSGSGANSGFRFGLHHKCMLLSGSESATFIFRPLTLANGLLRLGLHDEFTAPFALPANGCWIEMETILGVPGTIYGNTSAGGILSLTATSFVVTTTTWYRAVVALNANATLVTFTLYAAGAVLWTDTLAANIPTAAGQEVASAIIGASYWGGLHTIVDVDYIDAQISRPLNR